LFSNRFFLRVFSYLAVCGCLTAADFPPATTGQPVEQSSDWLETLSNLPVVQWFSRATEPRLLSQLHISPVFGSCAVAPLPEIQDPEGLAFEKNNGSDAVNVEGLIPAMARALTRFQELVRSAGGTVVVRSAYRPPSYQAHLQAVWLKWMLELRNNREQGCQLLRAEVHEEFMLHHLMETQEPVTSSDHTRGLAFDATVTMPARARLKRRRVSLDGLALLAGIRRPDIRRDPVHFKLAIGRAPRHA